MSTQRDPNVLYALNKQSYQMWLKPFSQGDGIAPKTLVQFLIDVPFYFPMTNKHNFSITSFHKKVLCAYKFSDLPEYRSMAGEATERKIEIRRSAIEMTYVTGEELDFDSNTQFEHPILTECFDTLLVMLNTLFLSYLIQTKDTNVYRVSKEMLNAIAPWRIINPDKWDEMQHGIFLLHTDMPYNPEPLKDEQFQNVWDFLPVVRDVLNPFILHEELYLTAERYIREGFYREACVFAQMMIENFFNTLHTQLLLAEGKTEDDAQQVREELGFKRTVLKEFHPRLGGQWRIELANTPFGQWYTNTYSMRNRVAHGGYFPTLNEASLAVTKAQEFRVYVVSLIEQKKKQYPALAQYFFPAPTNTTTLADLLGDSIGVLGSSEHMPDGAKLSEASGKTFTSILEEKRRRGHL